MSGVEAVTEIKEISFTVKLDEEKVTSIIKLLFAVLSNHEKSKVHALVNKLDVDGDNASLLADVSNDPEITKKTNNMLKMMVEKIDESGKISLSPFCQKMLENFFNDTADKATLQKIVDSCNYLFAKLQGDVDKDKVMLENIDALSGVLASVKAAILEDIFMKQPIMTELTRGSTAGESILVAMSKVGLSDEKHREELKRASEILAQQRLEDLEDAEQKAAAREAAAKAKAEADAAVAMQAAVDKAATLEAENAKNKKFINIMKELFASDGED